MASTLQQLADIITSGISSIDSVYSAGGIPYPDLNDATPSTTGDISSDKDLARAKALVIAACGQLIASLQAPAQTLIQSAASFSLSGAIGVIEALHISEILREAGPKGLHVNEISRITGQDPQKLSRLLRLLSSHHIFQEVAPDVYAHNRVSLELDTGKIYEDIMSKPMEKYNDTSGTAATVGHVADEMFKAGAYLRETLLNPETALSYDSEAAALSTAFNENKNLFQWLEAPGREYTLYRFGMAMRGMNKGSPEAIMRGYSWGELPKGSVVVDVGGGFGNVTKVIAKAFPDLKYVVQDRAPTIEEAIKLWEVENPDAISSGRVTLQVQDFFQPQIGPSPAVYMLRHILHNWPNAQCLTILRHLRTSATPGHTKLLVIDPVVLYASPIKDGDESASIPGALPPQVPTPLLSNLGRAALDTHNLDFIMMVALNAQERTLGGFVKLGKVAGWKLESVRRGEFHSYLVFVPF